VPDIEYSFLADAADARPGQKFAVIGGGIARLGGPTFPLRHPHLALVVGLRVTAPELGSPHLVRFLVMTPSGATLSEAEATITASGGGDGRDTVMTFAIDLWNLSLPEPGDYSIRILIDGSERKRVPLFVEQRERAPRSGTSGPEEATSSGLQKPPFPPPTGQA
jgi:hypothetical protein